MIQIEDNDMPIDAAKKIITGTKIVELSDVMKTVRKALSGNQVDNGEYDMFELEEIKEIADYLIVYYNSHKNGD